MNCTNCGAEIKDGVKFCTNCGANLSQQVVQSEPEQAQTPTASMDVPATPEGAVPLQKRNTQRTIAIACGLLILLVVVFVGGLFLWKALTPKELLLDADTIKDEALLNTLTVKYDKDGDGKLSEEELGEVQTLELDSGNDYSYLYLFRNLTSVNVKNSDVTSLDLSKNDNLKNADFRDAPNIADIKLPDMPSYDDVKLPDNDNVNVTFPENSEYEVKYVPKKVEETRTKDEYNWFASVKCFEQTVESATKVTSYTQTYTTGQTSTTTYDYNEDGTIKTVTDDSSKMNFQYENNQLVKQSTSTTTAEGTNKQFQYNSDGTAATCGSFKFENLNDEYFEKYNGPSSSSMINNTTYNYWRFDTGRLSKFANVMAGAGAGRDFNIYDYEYDSKGLCVSETVSRSGGGDAVASLTASTSEGAVEFEYDENGKLIKTSYPSGGVSSYEYDNRGNLVRISTAGDNDMKYITTTIECSVEYSLVVAKKSQVPLSFIVLPGTRSNGVVNLATEIREYGVSGEYGDVEFKGKFWWDEENIINNQVEAAKRNTATLEAENSSTSNVEVESHSVQVSVPCDPYYSEQERENKTWNYDLLSNPNNSEGIKKINSVIQDSMDKSVQKAESIPYGKDADRAILERNIKVTYLNKKIVCYSDGNYSTGWGAHGSYNVGSVVFDLDTGEVIDIASYFGITQEELQSEVKQAVATNLTTNPSDINSTEEVVGKVKLEKSDSLGISLKGRTKLGFSEDGALYYLTDEYEIGSYASGMRSIVVRSDNSSDVGKELKDIES